MLPLQTTLLDLFYLSVLVAKGDRMSDEYNLCHSRPYNQKFTWVTYDFTNRLGYGLYF